ncbi:8545_t:CDS:1 [Ambispora leptoticha]|uniref:8545_t:CDS:1 n=1 Tax=Ambispora leptoticha TaxID=144679 RepID=A0A9N9BMC2_9GLOM|nr:8545_t:CDS:1 [Ambispora leptoticha]
MTKSVDINKCAIDMKNKSKTTKIRAKRSSKQQQLSPTHLNISVPLPVDLKPTDIIVKKKDGNFPSKPPNAFIIYRREFVKVLRASGFKYKQQDVSALASKAWEEEPTIVQNQYRRLAQDCSTILLEMRRNMLGDTERDWRTYMSPNGGEIIFASIISSENVATDSPYPSINNNSRARNEKFIWENNFSVVEPSTRTLSNEDAYNNSSNSHDDNNQMHTQYNDTLPEISFSTSHASASFEDAFNTTHLLGHLLPDSPTSHPSPTTSGSEYHLSSSFDSLDSSSSSSSYLSNSIGESQKQINSYAFHYEIATATSPVVDLPTPESFDESPLPPHFTWSDLNYVTPLDFHEDLKIQIDDDDDKKFQYPSTNSTENDNGNQSSSGSCSNRGGGVENNFYLLQDGIFTPSPQIVHWNSFTRASK